MSYDPQSMIDQLWNKASEVSKPLTSVCYIFENIIYTIYDLAEKKP